MSKVSRRALLLQPLLFATALALGSLAGGAVPAHAGCVNVTGAYPGGDATATATATSPNTSSCATATGGAGSHFYGIRGGAGGAGGWATSSATTLISTGSGSATATASSVGGVGGDGTANLEGTGGAGGHGGAASSAATATNTEGSASANATSTGGNGGNGGLGQAGMFHFPGRGGDGGGARATSSATGGGAGTVFSQAIATGGAGGVLGGLIYGGRAPGGSASAAASADSTGSGQLQAIASAYAGAAATPGTAVAQSVAKNSSGEALATASAPGAASGTSPSALTAARVGAGRIIPINLTPGQAVSNAVLTPTGGEGEMSATYGGIGFGQPRYEATAVFDFRTTSSETLTLSLLGDKVAGIGFDSLELLVSDDGATLLNKSFSGPTGLGAAEAFFTRGRSISLGAIAAGNQSIEIEYLLGYTAGTSATSGGFGFTYDLAPAPVAATPLSATIPEPSTWAMVLLGFAGLAFAGYRAARGGAAIAA